MNIPCWYGSPHLEQEGRESRVTGVVGRESSAECGVRNAESEGGGCVVCGAWCVEGGWLVSCAGDN